MYSSAMDRSGIDRPEVSQERLSLERLSVAVQAAGLTCWEFSYAQRRFTWFDGLPADEALHAAEIEKRQAAILSSIVPEDAARLRELVARAVRAGEQCVSSVVRRRDSQGNSICLRMDLRFFRDSEGKPVRTVGSTRDVTAEVVAEEKLRQQAALLEETQRRLDRRPPIGPRASSWPM
jgi:PAS domain S-box-containing protein